MLDNLNLIHMNGRVYDNVIGRFMSADPIEADGSQSQDWNPYSYVSNNPATFVDPTGFEEEDHNCISDSPGCNLTPTLPEITVPGVRPPDWNIILQDSASSGSGAANSAGENKDPTIQGVTIHAPPKPPAPNTPPPPRFYIPPVGGQPVVPPSIPDLRDPPDPALPCTSTRSSNSTLNNHIAIGAGAGGLLTGGLVVGVLILNVVGAPEVEGAEAVLFGLAGEPIVSTATVGLSAATYGTVMGGLVGFGLTTQQCVRPK